MPFIAKKKAATTVFDMAAESVTEKSNKQASYIEKELPRRMSPNQQFVMKVLLFDNIFFEYILFDLAESHISNGMAGSCVGSNNDNEKLILQLNLLNWVSFIDEKRTTAVVPLLITVQQAISSIVFSCSLTVSCSLNCSVLIFLIFLFSESRHFAITQEIRQ